MFPTDMTELRRKLMAALATVVSGLTQPETILPTIKELGVRHAKLWRPRKRTTPPLVRR